MIMASSLRNRIANPTAFVRTRNEIAARAVYGQGVRSKMDVPQFYPAGQQWRAKKHAKGNNLSLKPRCKGLVHRRRDEL